MKQHLIIYAHPSPRSFSNQLKNMLLDRSESMGYKSVVRDLYAMNFNPILSPNDLQQLKSGQTPDDIAVEQTYLQESELVTFIFPLWWAGYPAIIKGYIDRILSYGFAYKAGTKGIEGLLKGKKVVLFTSMGNSLEQYEEKNLFESFRHTLGHEIFTYCGMEIVHHQFFPQVPDASVDERDSMVEQALEVYDRLKIEVTA